MKFTDFKTTGSVCKKFNLKCKTENFVQEKAFILNEHSKSKLLKNFYRGGVFVSEYAICEMLISPLLVEIADENNLPIWSHCQFDVSEVDLSGVPDYLFGLSEEGGDEYKPPIICAGEAKKNDFRSSWGQVFAEMYAAQQLNKCEEIPIYGLVTTGDIWEFAILNGIHFTINKTKGPKIINLIVEVK